MLDTNHPQSEHIFRASGFLDGLLKCSQRMSVVPSAVRADLLPKVLSRIDDMRALAAEHFTKSTAIAPALDELARVFTTLANLGDGNLVADATDGDEPCPACGGDVMKFDAMATIKGQAQQWIILCKNCTSEFSKPFRELESGDGFCTMFI